MNINENLRNKEKKQQHKSLISVPNHHQTTIVACSVSSVIQFDKFFHLSSDGPI